jgi:hypothetical protein
MAAPVRLPGTVKEVFEQRLRQTLPLAADKVLNQIRGMRGGELNDPRFFQRFVGQGKYADTLSQVFAATAQRLGFGPFPEPRSSEFRRPSKSQQLSLFGE